MKYNTLDLSKYPKLNRYKSIYYIGDPNLLALTSVTIVGSRKMTTYGSRVIDYVLSGIYPYKLATVSGFVDGVDLQVLKDSIKYHVPHIICLGYGLDKFNKNYLSSLVKLLKNPSNLSVLDLLIKSRVLILSQFSFDQSATNWTFPKRDELLASLGSCTLVIEAGVKSGTKYTVDRAIKENKKVFSVPGSIFSASSKGTNFLISRSLKDPNILPFNEIKDLITFLNIKAQGMSGSLQTDSPISAFESIVLNLLNGVELHMDDIAKASGISVSKLSTILTQLEIKGLIKKKGGQYFRT